MSAPATPIELDRAFDDPFAVRRLVEGTGPYPSIASFLPPVATLTAATRRGEAPGQLPWFRANWAVNGHTDIAGVDAILHNSRFIQAATKLFDGAPVRPTTVVVNVNAPMGPGATHVDIPSFRGANRDRYPLKLLQAMGTSGLFERWRILEAGAVTWFYEGAGGAYDYWPDGLAGEMRSRRPPFGNVALVADNDRMYHRIGWIGDVSTRPPPLAAAAVIDHDRTGRWTITDSGRTVQTYPDEQVRISILWKAQVDTGPVGEPLTADEIVDVFARDLAARHIEPPHPSTDPTTDIAWLDLVHRTYYAAVPSHGHPSELKDRQHPESALLILSGTTTSFQRGPTPRTSGLKTNQW